MLDDYRESFRRCAERIPNWQTMPRNELGNGFASNADNPELQDAYFSALMYLYWHLIPKYYYMSSNVASPEDVYEWLEDSVYGCLKATSWNREGSSIYKDPNGLDKVINRCMKCARLTYYQFINRKKRRDNFGMLSLDELAELFGTGVSEPSDDNEVSDMTSWALKTYIKDTFDKKDYFVAFLIEGILTQNVFDVKLDEEKRPAMIFNPKKLAKFMLHIEDEFIAEFSKKYGISVPEVVAAIAYFKDLKSNVMLRKIEVTFERLQHDPTLKTLVYSEV